VEGWATISSCILAAFIYKKKKLKIKNIGMLQPATYFSQKRSLFYKPATF